MTENENEEYLSAGEAAAYLARKWGIPSYKASAFKTLRYRWDIQPAIVTSNASLWRKSDLDKIPKPDRTRARGAKTKRKDEDGEGSTSSVTYAFSSQARAALGATA